MPRKCKWPERVRFNVAMPPDLRQEVDQVAEAVSGNKRQVSGAALVRLGLDMVFDLPVHEIRKRLQEMERP